MEINDIDHYPGVGGALPTETNLATSSRWQQVVVESRKKARILMNDMDQSRREGPGREQRWKGKGI